MRTRKRIAALASTAVLVMGVSLMGGSPSAIASQCSDKTGGSSHWVMWTGSKYTCAYQAKSGKMKINPGNYKSWTSSTAKGYEKRDHRWKQTGGVKVTYIYSNGGGTGIGSSITFSAMHAEASSRHWGAAVIWNTPSGGKVSSSQYKGDNYEYKTNRFLESKLSMSGPASIPLGTNATYSVQVKNPDGSGTPTGSVALMLQMGKDQDPPKKSCDNKSIGGVDLGIGQANLSGGKATLVTPALNAGAYKVYAVYQGQPVTNEGLPAYCLNPTTEGLTPAQGKSMDLTVTGTSSGSLAQQRTLAEFHNGLTPTLQMPQTRGEISPLRLRVINRTFVTGNSGSAPAKITRCAKNWVPVQANAASSTTAIPDNLFTTRGAKVSIKRGILPKGTTVHYQIVCRPKNAPVAALKSGVYGSRFSDNIATKRKGSTVFAGLGNDFVLVRHARSGAFGGPGNDRIIVTTPKGAAVGGPGNDYLEARKGGQVLLVGGLGRDTLVGAKGKTVINALDGRGGDVIYCKSKKNRVYADKGDRLVGPCKKLKTPKL